MITAQTLNPERRTQKLHRSSFNVPRFTPHPAPLRTVDAGDHAQTFASARRCDCPTCGKVFVAGAIVTDEPEFLNNEIVSSSGSEVEHYTGWAVKRTLFCDHCDHLIIWREKCDADGSHLRGNIAGDAAGESGYGLLRARTAINKHLRLHPQAAGVAQS